MSMRRICIGTALALAAVSTVSANPINRFSDNAEATVSISSLVGTTGGSLPANIANVQIESFNSSVSISATNNLNSSFHSGSLTLGNAAANGAAAAAKSGAGASR